MVLIAAVDSLRIVIKKELERLNIKIVGLWKE